MSAWHEGPDSHDRADLVFRTFPVRSAVAANVHVAREAVNEAFVEGNGETINEVARIGGVLGLRRLRRSRPGGRGKASCRNQIGA
jgi:hypothetical protein